MDGAVFVPGRVFVGGDGRQVSGQVDGANEVQGLTIYAALEVEDTRH